MGEEEEEEEGLYLRIETRKGNQHPPLENCSARHEEPKNRRRESLLLVGSQEGSWRNLSGQGKEPAAGEIQNDHNIEDKKETPDSDAHITGAGGNENVSGSEHVCMFSSSE